MDRKIKNENIQSLDKYQNPSFSPDVLPIQASLQAECTDCIISRCRYIKLLYFNYNYGWEKNKSRDNKTHRKF